MENTKRKIKKLKIKTKKGRAENGSPFLFRVLRPSDGLFVLVDTFHVCAIILQHAPALQRAGAFSALYARTIYGLYPLALRSAASFSALAFWEKAPTCTL